MKKSELDRALLKQLREQGYTYEEIRNHLKQRGIEVSLNTIRTRIKELYAQDKSEEPQSKNKKQINIPEAEIITLLENGLTYEEIVEHLKKNGIKVSAATVSRRIFEICKTRETKFAGNKNSNKGKIRRNVPEEELIKLKEQGLTYREIAEHFNNLGIKISFETVRQRIKQIEKKQTEQPKRDKKKLIEQILKLKEYRNATDDQIETLARTYGVSLDGTRKNKLLLDEEEIDLGEH